MIAKEIVGHCILSSLFMSAGQPPRGEQPSQKPYSCQGLVNISRVYENGNPNV